MLERPDLDEERLVARLGEEYGIRASELAFLPLGADVNTAVYRVVSDEGGRFFLKPRRGAFSEPSVALPKFLSGLGIAQVMAPLATRGGRLWILMDGARLIVYPFVEGRNGYDVDFTDRQWGDFGAALRRIHSAALPRALARRLRREGYSPRWRDKVRAYADAGRDLDHADRPAADLAAMLRARREEILNLVARASGLALSLLARKPEFVPCHSDLHAGNLLIDASGSFFIVDWDEPILAPKERDLMFVGGGQGFLGHTPREEEMLFYEGYGSARIDPIALSYYRYERIIEDIAAFCDQLLATRGGGRDRECAYRYFASIFDPMGVLEIARESDEGSRSSSILGGVAPEE